MRVLQNQDSFAVAKYRDLVTPLIDAPSNPLLRSLVRRIDRSGFLAGMILYHLSSGFDVTITGGHRAAAAFGLLSRLLARRPRVQIAREFYLTSDDFPWFRRVLYRFSLADITAVVVNASAERSTYAEMLALPTSRFHFIPWPSNIDQPSTAPARGDYYLAAGRSMRDWKTFAEAVRGLDTHFVVVATARDARCISWPENVEIHTDIPRASYLQILTDARGVIVPLVETERSTGQACFLEAMAIGKPVLTARVVGCLDYVRDGDNGLLYEPGDAADLRRKIEILASDTDLRRNLALRAIDSIETHFNKRVYVDQMIQVIEDSVRNAGVPRGA